jgi:MFS family permease
MKPNTTKLTLLLAATLTVMSGATIAASLPQIAEVFKSNPNALLLSKLVLTLPAIFIVFSSPVFGKLSDKFGRVKILNFCLLLYAISGVSGYFLNDLYSILIGRALLGIAVGGISTMVITLVGDLFENVEREKFIGLQAAFMSLGGVVFIALGGLLAQQNWKLPFLIYFFSLPILALSLIYLKAVPVQKVNPKKTTNLKLFKPLIGAYLIAFLSMVIFYLIPTQVPFLLESKGIKNPVFGGIAIAVATFSSALVSLNFRKIRQKLSTGAIFYWLFAFISVGYLFVSLSNSYTQILISLIISGLGVGLIMPNVNTWLLKITPDEIRGSATGLLTTSLFAGQFASPIIVDTFTETTISNVFGIAGLGIIIVMFPLIYLQFRSK